jgi:hypothetical protein
MQRRLPLLPKQPSPALIVILVIIQEGDISPTHRLHLRLARTNSMNFAALITMNLLLRIALDSLGLEVLFDTTYSVYQQ